MSADEGSPASGDHSARLGDERASEGPIHTSRWLSLLDAPGVLLWIAALTLAGGALIHASVDRLPASYSWSLPMSTLRNVVGKEAFPLWALSAFVAGALSVRGRVRLREDLAAGVAWLRRVQPRELPLLMNRRAWWALAAAAAALVLDAVIFPDHQVPAVLAVSIAAAIAVVRSTPRRAAEAFFNVLLSVLVFTAVCYWFTILKTLTFGSKVQWDAQIVNFERAIVGVYPHRWAAAIFAKQPSWVRLLDRTYFAIFEHMAVGTCFLLGTGDARERGRYLGALCWCYVLGAPLYLLMPAAGPAYFDPTAFAFLREQPLTVNYVQGALFKNTAAVNEGKATIIQTWGYIACMPSLHMAHELVMLYFARRSRLFFAVTLVFFLTTAVSVVVLGWHYPTDILAGMLLGVVGILASTGFGSRLFPRFLRSAYAPPG